MAGTPLHRPVQWASQATKFWSCCLSSPLKAQYAAYGVIAGCRTLNDVLRCEAMPAYLGLLLCLSAELLQLCGPCIHAQALLAQLHDPLKVCQLQRSPGASVVPLRQAQADLPS